MTDEEVLKKLEELEDQAQDLAQTAQYNIERIQDLKNRRTKAEED